MRGWLVGGWGRELVMRQRVCEVSACVCVYKCHCAIIARVASPRKWRRKVPQLQRMISTACGASDFRLHDTDFKNLDLHACFEVRRVVLPVKMGAHCNGRSR